MAYAIYTDEKNGITVYRSEKLDYYGYPRSIVHFLAFLTDDEKRDYSRKILDLYELAAKRAKMAGYRKYTAKEFGGGFIQQYDYCGGKENAARVLAVRGK